MLNNLASVGANAQAHALRNLGWKPPGPWDLVVSSFESKLYTSSGLKSSMKGESGGNGRFARAGGVKELVENVELKKELKRFA